MCIPDEGVLPVFHTSLSALKHVEAVLNSYHVFKRHSPAHMSSMCMYVYVHALVPLYPLYHGQKTSNPVNQ
jgi:hypothetical protein